jgi:transcriptional regulator with XRE-family HTH domain
MANENLQNALRAAGLTVEQFAEVIQVDPKSVQRWVTGNTTPYPRHRARIALALNQDERTLWPAQTTAPLDTTSASTRSDNGKGLVCEVSGSWAYIDDPDTPDPVALIANTDGAIDIYDARPEIRLGEELLDAVLARAAAGCRVRLLSTRPTMRLKPLIGQPRIEVRTIDGGAHTMIRAGNRLLRTIEMNYVGGQPGLLLLQRKTAGALFDRILDEFSADWHSIDDEDRDISSNDELEFRAELDEDDNEDEPTANTEPGSPATVPADTATTNPYTPASQSDGAYEERRWPGRQP